MTNDMPANVALLTDLVERLSLSLDQARADVAWLRRLKDAETDAVRISEELSQAQNDLATAHADAIMAKREAEFANLRNLTITVVPPDGRSLSAITAGYKINYERLTYDATARCNTWQAVCVNSFSALAPDVYRYLMLSKPSVLPPMILALAPDDADAAMDAYFLAMRRGYMTTPTIN